MIRNNPLDALPPPDESRGSAPEPLPLELVATLAAKFLEGDDYRGAVEKAAALIEASREMVRTNGIRQMARVWLDKRKDERKERMDSLSADERRRLTPAQKMDLQLPLTHNEVARYLMKEDRAPRARARLLAFLEKDDGGWTPEIRTKAETWLSGNGTLSYSDVSSLEERIWFSEHVGGTQRNKWATG